MQPFFLEDLFCLSKKSDEIVLCKACFVTGEHQDVQKPYVAHRSQNISPFTIDLELALAVLHSFDLLKPDV